MTTAQTAAAVVGLTIAGVVGAVAINQTATTTEPAAQAIASESTETCTPAIASIDPGTTVARVSRMRCDTIGGDGVVIATKWLTDDEIAARGLVGAAD